MTRRRSRSARLRLSLRFSATFFAMGTVVIVVIYLLARGGPTVDVSRAVPSPNGVTLITPIAPGSATAHRLHFSFAPRGAVQSVVVDQRNADVARLAVISWLVLAVTALLSTGVGWFGAGRVLRPLRAMTDKASTISAGNLGDRLAVQGPDDEFSRLGDAFDELLGRLESSFDAQRRFVANASHELRTPLTVDRTLLQVVLADPDADAPTLRAACEELIESGRSQERLLDGLLTLAVSERGLAERHPVELSIVAGEVATRFSDDAREHDVTVELSLEPAPTSGDPALIERLIANLTDNAIRYNHAAGRVGIATATRDGRAELTVTNTGPVIAPEMEEALFEPFRRLGRDRTGGADGHHGLGLSIVRAIADSHGGTVTAVPQRGGGLAVTVAFPV